MKPKVLRTLSGRLISDILEITDSLQINGLLMTIDIEKAFDSAHHFFIISVLNPRITSSNPRVISSNSRFTSSNLRVTSSNSRAQESLNH